MIFIYVKDFGERKGDVCYVAECEGKIIGAVWVRIMNDYGHVSDDMPSLAISFFQNIETTVLVQH